MERNIPNIFIDLSLVHSLNNTISRYLRATAKQLGDNK